MKPSTERVLRQLREHPDGVSELAWAPPVVIDGGRSMQRIAARIYELRQEGYVIRTRRLANGCATYLLVAEPGSAVDRAA